MYDRPQGGDPRPVVSHPGGDPHSGGVLHTVYTEGDPHPGARRSFFSPRRILSHRRKSSTGDKSASKPEGGEGLVKGEVGLGPPGKNPAL